MPILNFNGTANLSSRSSSKLSAEKKGGCKTAVPVRAAVARLNLVPIRLDFSGTRCQLLYWGLNPDNCNDSGPHAHSFYEACYVFKGRGAVRIDGRTHRLIQGQAFIIRPDQVHRISSGKDDPMGIYFWAFSLQPKSGIVRDDAALERLVDRFGRSSRTVCSQAGHISHLLDMLAGEAAARATAHHAVVQATTRALMLHTLRAFGPSIPARIGGDRGLASSARTDSRRGARRKSPIKAGSERYDQPLSGIDMPLSQPAGPVARARLFLHDNFMRPITVPEVAEHVHLGERQLARLFSKDQSVSVARYLQNLRIEAAGRLLLEASLSIKAIGRQVGYPDVAYFTALFRRATGLTPGEYRNSRGSVYPLRAHDSAGGRQKVPGKGKPE